MRHCQTRPLGPEERSRQAVLEAVDDGELPAVELRVGPDQRLPGNAEHDCGEGNHHNARRKQRACLDFLGDEHDQRQDERVHGQEKRVYTCRLATKRSEVSTKSLYCSMRISNSPGSSDVRPRKTTSSGFLSSPSTIARPRGRMLRSRKERSSGTRQRFYRVSRQDFRYAYGTARQVDCHDMLAKLQTAVDLPFYRLALVRRGTDQTDEYGGLVDLPVAIVFPVFLVAVDGMVQELDLGMRVSTSFRNASANTLSFVEKLKKARKGGDGAFGLDSCGSTSSEMAGTPWTLPRVPRHVNAVCGPRTPHSQFSISSGTYPCVPYRQHMPFRRHAAGHPSEARPLLLQGQCRASATSAIQGVGHSPDVTRRDGWTSDRLCRVTTSGGACRGDQRRSGSCPLATLSTLPSEVRDL